MNEDKKNKLNREIEADANKFNITVIILMALMSVACEVLNNVGVFLVDKNVMHIGMGIALIFLLIPISFYLVHDIFMKKETSIFYWPNLKGLIIGSVFIAVLSFNVALTNHSLILILVPSLVAAQYKNNKAVNHWVGVVSIILVPIGVYGGYFLGSLVISQGHSFTFLIILTDRSNAIGDKNSHHYSNWLKPLRLAHKIKYALNNQSD